MMESNVGGFVYLGEKVAEPKGGLVAWSEALETGIEVLDAQHKKYIDLLNDYLQKAAKFENDDIKAERLLASFNFLRDYAEEHFSTEDAIMEETSYPELAKHQGEHRYFNEHVQALAHDMERDGYSRALARKVNFYAIEWFIDHILGSDMQLVQFLKERNLETKANEIGA